VWGYRYSLAEAIPAAGPTVKLNLPKATYLVDSLVRKREMSYAPGAGLLSSWGLDITGHLTFRGADRATPEELAVKIEAQLGLPSPHKDFANSPYIYALAWASPGRVPTGWRGRGRR
jgi:hypothetical protein